MPLAMGRLPKNHAAAKAAKRKRGFTTMKNRVNRCLAMLAILCVMVTFVAVPLASAASYSKVYGQTQDRIRVRESASTNATIIDNIIKNACVYITSSKTSGSSTFVQIKYRNADGDVTTGWACQNDGKTTYIKALSAKQASDAFGVKDGNVPSKKVGTFTAAERKASASDSSNSYIQLNSSGTAVKNMQTKLKKLGYYTGELTGNAGTKTVAAIKAFQSKNGLTADGVAGPATLAKIDAAYDKLGASTSTSTSTASGSGLRLNSQGADVRDLQNDLTTLGYYWATISGNFGTKTETAVKRFQEENGLKADGVAGDKTLAAIAAAVKAKNGSSSSSSAGTNTTSGVLKLNSQGTAVSTLQTNLKDLGYYTASITGNFGSKTEAAVKKFQSAKGLTADGVAGAKTLAAIAAAAGSSSSSGSTSSASGLKYGATGDAVKDLQNDLTAIGYYYGDITGHYGSLTEQAVKKFQKSRNLTQDGVAGKKTLDAIASAVKGTGNSSAIGGSNSSGSSLRKGDSGTKVTDLQTRLKKLNIYYGEITGSFGDLTEKAVKKFQDNNDLTVDGIAGTDTLNKLYSLTGGSSSSSSTVAGSGSTVSTDKSYGRITKNNVYLRSKANTTSDAKANLTQGTPVRITQVYTTTDGVKWYYITAKVGSYTYKGYVRSDMMETITPTEYDKLYGSSDNNISDQEVLGMIKITADGVRLRYSPSTSADVVGEADKGDVFYYVDSVSGWYQTKAGYWISSYYATPLSGAEADEYQGSASSGSGTSYRNGSTGSGVLDLQTKLNALKYYEGKLSGNYGNLTEEAVRQFQKNNGLSADGVAGPKTIQAINAQYNNLYNSNGSTTEYSKVMYNLSWTKTVDGSKTGKKIITNLFTASKNVATLKDIKTGLSFNITLQSAGNHVDAEPSTASDTATMCRIYNVNDADSIPYNRRAMVMTVGSEQFVCSVYGEVHGQQNITNNNFNGQFCVHFLDSTNHSTGNGYVPEEENHQAIIKKAVDALEKDGIDVRENYP